MIVILLLIVGFTLPHSAYAASLFFSPEEKKVNVDDHFFVEIFVESKTKAMNAVDGIIRYPTDLLDSIKISTTGSSVNFWLVKPAESEPGLIHFQGAILNPGYKGDRAKIFSIEFSGKKEGIASLEFSKGIILANDGKGTDISSVNKNSEISIKNSLGMFDKKLVKTENSKSVYYIRGNRRYIFLNEQIYKTWYPDFSSVQLISETKIAEYMIGGRVKPYPNRMMIKMKTDPRVYVVSDAGKIRWVTSEALAQELFGHAWAKKIVDISDAEIAGFELGAPLEKIEDLPHKAYTEVVI